MKPTKARKAKTLRCDNCERPFASPQGQSNCMNSHFLAQERVAELDHDLMDLDVTETKRVIRAKISRELKGIGKKTATIDCTEATFLKVFGEDHRLSKKRGKNLYTLELYGQEISDVLDTCIGKVEPRWEERENKEAVKYFIAKEEGNTEFSLKIKYKEENVIDYLATANGKVPSTSTFPQLKLSFTVQADQQKLTD